MLHRLCILLYYTDLSKCILLSSCWGLIARSRGFSSLFDICTPDLDSFSDPACDCICTPDLDSFSDPAWDCICTPDLDSFSDPACDCVLRLLLSNCISSEFYKEKEIFTYGKFSNLYPFFYFICKNSILNKLKNNIIILKWWGHVSWKKIWPRSDWPFWRLLDTYKQTDKVKTFIYRKSIRGYLISI